MRHVPHLFLSGPWAGGEIPLSDEQAHHLRRVLRLADGATISYTDGIGSVGEGALHEGSVVRGKESYIGRPEPEISVAVAPPRKVDRVRFLTEKLAEIGIDRLIWLETRLGEGQPPRPEKAAAWAQAALEQSRGAWLLHFEGPTPLNRLLKSATLWVAERETLPPPSVVEDGILVVGPEAGFAEGEVPAWANRIGLGKRVLRVETAAVVGATVLLDRCGRLSW